MKMRSQKSRRIIVDWKFQFKKALAVTAINVVLMLFMAAILSWFYLLAWDGSGIVVHNIHVPMLVVIAVAAGLIFSLIWSLVQGRMVAGSAKKLADVLKKAAEGDIPDLPVRFRKTDYFRHVLEGPLNDCLARLQREISRNKRAASDISVGDTE